MLVPHNLFQFSLILILIFLSLTGCNPSSTPTTSLSEHLPVTSTPTPVQSLTPQPSTQTITITPTTVPSKTQRPTPSTTSTALPSPTLGPTMTNEELKGFLLNQLNPAVDCQLPCWWGAYPGQTTWDEIRDFFLTNGLLPKQFYDTENVQIGVEDKDSKTGFGLIYLINYHKSPRVIEAISVGAKLGSRDRITYNHPDYYKRFAGYTLPSILTNLGKPTGVKVFATQTAIESGEYPFDIVLDYPEQGVSISYEGFTKMSGDQFQLCPQDTFFTLYLWSPHYSDMSLVNNGRGRYFIPWEYLPRYKDVEDASGMTLDEFYSKFQDQGNQNCLIAPINIWSP